ncbi:hypothetical protein WA1_18785 [Scytonema hofmannii PCC 7110]|uniref:Uncharacterized protein n=1 Tax=Scytonema hofmannii PCC 7110 TaxID=128403 RepID=A0A139XBI4_9CYAN|nr:hypothetical protein [Scytonema hofmannii]KYC42049.1 hypothetical protein WA1_18785 [Scytonema hofmannii PCC 7110]
MKNNINYHNLLVCFRRLPHLKWKIIQERKHNRCGIFWGYDERGNYVEVIDRECGFFARYKSHSGQILLFSDLVPGMELSQALSQIQRLMEVLYATTSN